MFSTRSGTPRWRFHVLAVALVTVALLGASCGSSDTTPVASSPSAPSSPGTTSAELADRLAARLDTPNAGVDAVVLALNEGFSSTQIVEGIESDSLEADGSISGETPQDAFRNFVDLDSVDEGASGSGSVGEVKLAAFFQGRLTLAALRATAERNADLYGGSSVGNSALEFMIRLMVQQGFSAGEVTEMVVLGIDDYAPDFGEDCPAYRVGAEVLVGSTGFPDDCKRPPGRYPADLFSSEAESASNGAATSDAVASAAPSTDSPASESADADFPAPISFSGGAIGDPLKTNSVKGELEPENFFLDATVANGQVEMTLVVSYWTWLRGGEEEVYVDQNCGARLVEELAGTGPAGPDTRIEMTVVSSEFIDQTGALCQPGDGDIFLSSPGDASRPFIGKADHTGISGRWGGPAVALPVGNE